jgi:uncharacterized protein HemY
VVAALELVERTLERASAGSGTNVQAPMLFRIRGYALMQQEHYIEAEEALTLSLEVARVRNAEHELAFTLDALAELARRKGEEAPSDVVAERDSIYRRLGIVSRRALRPPPVAV